MLDQRSVEAILFREGQLQHYYLILRQTSESGQNRVTKHELSLPLVGRMDIDFRLEDRHQTSRQYLRTDLELLLNDGIYSLAVRTFDHRPFLGAEHTLRNRALQQLIQSRHRLHQ